ncbi:MAG: glycosyltransferase family 9 protein [Candidatus Omnitrophica bacterium]|nr:glycosyltransferase family 9 protein [Candidatus Omnitrophota bacterium]MCM8790568.1 glycosyltransferase family 9 protein [Candidatus Omnitrophota bacterium]
MKDNPRILIINPFGIGDVLFSTPLVECIKKKYPGGFIGYVCNKRAYEVIRSNPDIDKIFVYEKDDYRDLWKRSRVECMKRVIGFLREIKKERFDIAIDLSLGYQYSLLLKLLGVKKRAGFNFRDRGRFLTDKIDIESFSGKHVIEYYLDLLKPLNIDSGNIISGPKVYVSDLDKRAGDRFLAENGVGTDELLVGMLPGCGASWGLDAKYRRWDKASFAEVANLLAERYKAKIILFGDVREIELCEAVQALMKHNAIMACGKVPIGMFLALASRCALIITNDGGPLHMSVGLGVKTISIFGPVDEKVYGPYPPSEKHMTITSKVPCRPCYRNFKYVKCVTQKCLDSIKPEDVMRAVDKLLEKR